MPPNAAERVSSFPHFSEFHLTKLFWKVKHPDPMGDVCSLLITTSSNAEHNFKLWNQRLMTSRHAAEGVSSFPHFSEFYLRDCWACCTATEKGGVHFSEFHLTKLFWKMTHPDPMGDVCSLHITTSSNAEHNFKLWNQRLMTSRHAAAEGVSSFPHFSEFYLRDCWACCTATEKGGVHFSEFHLTKLFWKLTHPNPMRDVDSLLVTRSSNAEHNLAASTSAEVVGCCYLMITCRTKIKSELFILVKHAIIK
jgi:hypothetical protein